MIVEKYLKNAQYAPVDFTSDQGLIAFYNPTNILAVDQVKQIETNFRELWPASGPLRLVACDLDELANQQRIEVLQTEGPMHLSAHGGDGTFNKAFKAVLDARFQGTSAVSGLGNARDLAITLNTGRYQQNPIAALTKGWKDFFRPLDISVTKPDGQVVNKTANSYGTIGFSAEMARYFDSSEYRESRKSTKRLLLYLNEAKIINKYLKNSELFTINDSLGERQVIDLDILNSGRMAKTKWLKYSHLFTDRAAITEIGGPSKKDLISAAGKLLLGKKMLNYGQQASYTVSGSDHLILQYDGETMDLEDGSVVDLSISDQQIAVARTRL